METKVCKKCGRELPIDQFANLHFGQSSTCKECTTKACSEGRRKKNELELNELKSQVERARSTKLSEFTPRELMVELKRRGYTFTMEYTETHTIKSDNL